MYVTQHFICSAVFYSQFLISPYWAAKCCAITVYLSFLNLSLKIHFSVFYFFIEKSHRIRKYKVEGFTFVSDTVVHICPVEISGVL